MIQVKQAAIFKDKRTDAPVPTKSLQGPLP